MHPTKKHMMSVCIYIGDINLDHLVQVIAPRFLYNEVTIFAFVINEQFVGRYYSETM